MDGVCGIYYFKYKVVYVNYLVIDLYDNEDKLKQCNGIILLIEPGEITNDEIIYLNQFANIYEDKIIGWMSINRKLQLNT